MRREREKGKKKRDSAKVFPPYRDNPTPSHFINSMFLFKLVSLSLKVRESEREFQVRSEKLPPKVPRYVVEQSVLYGVYGEL